jgi:DNA-directed RNA polymerase subunit RPC12/RpoP
MGLLKKLRGSHEADEQETYQATPECAHRILIAQWDDVNAMGDESQANGYRCDACGATFSRADGEQLRRDAAEQADALRRSA